MILLRLKLALMLSPFELSYTNINMMVYIVFIPLIWGFIIDRKLRTGVLFCSLYLVFLLFVSLMHLKPIVDFSLLVGFIKYMQKIHHCTYAESCVIWCMLMPLVVTILLIALPRRTAAKSKMQFNLLGIKS